MTQIIIKSCEVLLKNVLPNSSTTYKSMKSYNCEFFGFRRQILTFDKTTLILYLLNYKM